MVNFQVIAGPPAVASGLSETVAVPPWSPGVAVYDKVPNGPFWKPGNNLWLDCALLIFVARSDVNGQLLMPFAQHAPGAGGLLVSAGICQYTFLATVTRSSDVTAGVVCVLLVVVFFADVVA